MNDPNFVTAFSVDQTPHEAFAAIINVRGWWSEEIEGTTDKLGAEFAYHYVDVHRCKMKITEFVPGKKSSGSFWTTISISLRTNRVERHQGHFRNL